MRLKNETEHYTALLKQQGCSAEVVAHCRAVAAFALRIAERIPCDRRTVYISALVHDLGRAVTHGITHAIAGEALARTLKLPSEIQAIIRTHIGAGIPTAEAQSMGLPAKDFMPQTIEARIVAHADSLFNSSTRRTLAQTMKKLEEKGLTAAAQRIKALHEDLSELAGIDLDQL